MNAKWTQELVAKAIKDYQPYAVIMMFSGGDDSLAAKEFCNQLGIKVDFIMHGVTGTGIQETHDFVKSVVAKSKSKYLEANAGKSFENYVLRKGFFGVGPRAHDFTYHVLKAEHFVRVVSQVVRQRKRNRNILFLNGARRHESKRREVTMINPIRMNGSNIWVNVINDETDNDVRDFLEGNSIERNPVSKLICRSGECNCGSMLNKGDRVEIGIHFPRWKKWLDALSKAVHERGFLWDWGEPLPKGLAMEKKGQLNMFQPMCQNCVINYKRNKKVDLI